MSTDVFGLRGRMPYEPSSGGPDNPLLVTKHSSYVGPLELSTPFSGSRLVEDGTQLATAIRDGDWVSGTLAGVSAAGDAIAAAIDPIGQAIAMGVGWLLDHVWPLNEWLNELTGDSAEVQAAGQTWGNIAASMGTAAADVEVALRHLTEEQGLTAEAARLVLAAEQDHIGMAGQLSDALSFGLGVASTIVQVVHDLVRDAIGDVVGKMASAAIQELCSLGLATPKVIADVIALVNKWVGRLSKKVEDLVRSIDALRSLFAKIEPIWSKLKVIFDEINAASRRVDTWAEDFGRGLAHPGSTGGIPAPHVPSAPRPTGEAPVDLPGTEPMPDHGKLPSDPVPSESTGPLISDPDARFGRDLNQTPYSRGQYDERFVNPDDWPRYPPNNGAVAGTTVSTTDVGAFAREHGRFVDRIGYERGGYLAVDPAGGPVSFEQRSLPAGDVAKPHHRYEFTGHLPDGWQIETSQVAPWFGRQGGATQVRVIMSNGRAARIEDLLDSEYYVLRQR